MATTDQRAGFRFPWEGPASQGRSTDGQSEEQETPPGDTGALTGTMTGDPAHPEDPRAQMITQTDASAEAKSVSADAATVPAKDEIRTAPSPGSNDEPAAAAAAAPPPGASSSERSNRLRAELVRAMRTAAEESRGASLEQVRAEAKAQIERIHARSGDHVVELRRQSDAEIASIREWSKAEIARIRSETDARIERAKSSLEADLEDHAAQVEQHIERAQARIQQFEAEMEAFFEQLEAIDDPGAFAAAAAGMPEPPDLDDIATAVDTGAPDAEARGQAETEPPAEATAAPEQTSTAEGTSAVSPTTVVGPPEQAGSEVEDPRLVALRNGHDLGAAEAEAAAESQAESGAASVAEAKAGDEAGSGQGSVAEPDAASRDGSPVDEAETLGEDALAARLGIQAGEALAAARADDAPPEAPAARATTRVVVVGLVSVSSIASFKRQVSAIEGVRSVGVSSGPDGEFVFKVDHDPVLALQDVLPKVSGFAVRVVSSADGTIQVAASDPDLHD